MKIYANIAVVLLAFAALIFSGCGEQKTSSTTPAANEPSANTTENLPEGVAPENVNLTTEDDIIINANYYKPAEPASAAVILIHQRASNKEAWNPIIGKIVARGYAVLAIDMRGHGKSTKTTDGQTIGEPGQGQWWECKKDAQAALNFLLGKGIKKVAVVGASVGASIAVYCASENAEVKGIILLSPVIAIDRAVVQAVSSLGNRRVFMYYTRNDDRGGNGESVQQFAERMADTPHQAHAFDGSDHGMQMLGEKYGDLDVNENILKELDSILK
jgi:dienelactone hydrolase